MTVIFSLPNLRHSSLWLYISCGITNNSPGAPWSQVQATSLLCPDSRNFPSLLCPVDVLSSLLSQLRVHELKSLPSLTSSYTVNKTPTLLLHPCRGRRRKESRKSQYLVSFSSDGLLNISGPWSHTLFSHNSYRFLLFKGQKSYINT